MTTTVQELCTRALYISGIVSRDFEEPTGENIALARSTLDELLAEKLIDDKFIPYYTSQNFTGVVGQEEYDISNLIEIDTLTFVIDNVRFPTRPTSRYEFFGTARANDVNSLPVQWRMERTLNGSKVYIYFKPDQAYEFEIWGKFGLSATTSLTQNLEDTYDKYFLTFLKYELADRLCAEFEYEVPTGVERTLSKLKSNISKKSAVLDVKLQKTSTLGSKNGLNWGDANIGQGWRP